MEKATSSSTQTPNKGSDNDGQFSEISMCEFLDFLRSAYQVTDSVEDTLASAEGTSEVINWIKLKNTSLIKSKRNCHAAGTGHEKNNDSANKIKHKLDNVLNEGLLDSVLPYLIPANAPNTKARSTSKYSAEKPSNVSQKTTKDTSYNRRKTTDVVSTKTVHTKTDSEVEIHVCDEIKNIRKDFLCSQKLLVEKMGYFAEVTSGQKLEDMDISVHCDIGIFEWLMKWVKKEHLTRDDLPRLDCINVVPILVSAAFLQMEPLLHDCLLFCHKNMNDILQNNSNLNCLNDSIITRLAAMYTNTELESIKDKRDKIQSKLYCKLIASLCEPTSESVRGHWNNLAYIYRCQKCEQLVIPEIASSLPCHPTCMSINRYGNVVSSHVRDPNWNINDYILKLYTHLKSWRKVYWHLWGDCHFLHCAVCERPFPAHKLKWCSYHPEIPQYFTVDNQKAPLPVGRYPCCGERAYRFQVLNNFSGCQFQEHVPKKLKARDAAVFSILSHFRDVIDQQPPELIFPERLTRLVARDPSTSDGKLLCKEIFWWDGIQLIPPRTNIGLLGLLPNKTQQSTSDKRKQHPEERTETSTSTTVTSSSDDDTSCSEEQNTKRKYQPRQAMIKRKFPKKKPKGKYWQLNLSARSNQDLQRANEEQIIQKMIQFLSRKNGIESTGKHKNYLRHVTPSGGKYVRLEQEWKDAHNCTSLKKTCNTKHRMRSTKF